MRAFVTGSHCYSLPREDSDVDLVVRIDWDEAKVLLDGLGETIQHDSQHQPITVGKLNLILCYTDEAYCSWMIARDRVLHDGVAYPFWEPNSEQVVEFRDKAIQIHRECRTFCLVADPEYLALKAKSLGSDAPACLIEQPPCDTPKAPVEPKMPPEEWRKERSRLIQAQKNYCEKGDFPMFAPPDGYCWSCNQDCVTQRWEWELITGCRKCCRSFVD